MESNKHDTEQNKISGGSPSKPSTATGQSSTGSAGQPGAAPQRAREIVSEVGGGVQTAYDQTVKAVSEAYDKTSEVVSNTYDQTMTYGKENPGKLTLIAFGAGIGVGVLLASGLGGGRSRNTRFAEPIVAALSQVALELFR
jgi:ElaB protein